MGDFFGGSSSNDRSAYTMQMPASYSSFYQAANQPQPGPPKLSAPPPGAPSPAVAQEAYASMLAAFYPNANRPNESSTPAEGSNLQLQAAPNSRPTSAPNGKAASQEGTPANGSNEDLPGEDSQTGAWRKAPRNPQSEKRKQQNRAAQKSFRERKDRHLKDLEEKVAAQADIDNYTNALIQRLQSENEALRRLLGQHQGAHIRSQSFPAPPPNAPHWLQEQALASGSQSQLLDDRPSTSSSTQASPSTFAFALGPQPAQPSGTLPYYPMQGMPDQPYSVFERNFPDPSQSPYHQQYSSRAQQQHPSASDEYLAYQLQHSGVQGSSEQRSRPASFDATRYSVLEDIDVVDCRKAWQQICSHPSFPSCNADQLCSELRSRSMIFPDRPPVIQTDALADLIRRIPLRANARGEAHNDAMRSHVKLEES